MTQNPDDLARDFTEVRDITVIGAGPVGLTTAFWAGMREASSRIIDSLPELGGQLTTLYPEKWIFDVPGHPRVLAKDLVVMLREQAVEQFDVPVHLETTAETISWEGAGDDRIVVLHTDRGELRSRAVIIAGGHGAFEPKKLPVSDVDMEPWEGCGASYLVGDKSEFAGKKVVIIGGGDSACDWVINLLDTAEHVTLVHRREGFRAHEATVSQVKQAAETDQVSLQVPYVVKEVRGNGAVEGVVLHHASDEAAAPIELECDAILLQLGFSTKLGPLKDWGLELEKNAIVVDGQFKTNLEGVWACGDITTFDGKIKLIATGFGEAAIAVAQAVHSFRPEMKLQPAYSTNTGVPGGAEGQP
jgi:ferredoxin/flavodoxin---NADP+ reductase